MRRRPPRSPRTDPRFPFTSVFRSRGSRRFVGATRRRWRRDSSPMAGRTRCSKAPCLMRRSTPSSRRAERAGGMAVYFTSDTHFGHGGALGLFKRPFASVAERDRAMIDRWNETVGAADEVWHLGDFAVRRGASDTAHITAATRGGKHLI